VPLLPTRPARSDRQHLPRGKRGCRTRATRRRTDASPQRRFRRSQQSRSHRVGVPPVADRLTQRHGSGPPGPHPIVAAAHGHPATPAARPRHHLTADAPDRVWAADFQFDATTDGRPIKIVSIIDELTRTCLGGLVERSITGEELISELDRLAAERGYPAVLRCDNGPELACRNG
jgi:hypothetical protein